MPAESSQAASSRRTRRPAPYIYAPPPHSSNHVGLSPPWSTMQQIPTTPSPRRLHRSDSGSVDLSSTSPSSSSKTSQPTDFNKEFGELGSQLRSSPTLVSTIFDSTAGTYGLTEVLWPMDEDRKAVLPTDLLKYCNTHAFVENRIFCFCSLKVGKGQEVKVFIPKSSQSEHKGQVCIACARWRPGGRAGCSYFVNVETFAGIFPWQEMRCYPIKPDAAVLKRSNALLKALADRRAAREAASSQPRPTPANATEDYVFGNIFDCSATSSDVVSHPSSQSAEELIQSVFTPSSSTQSSDTLEDLSSQPEGSDQSCWTNTEATAIIPGYFVNAKTQKELANIEPGFVDDGRRILTHPPEGHEYDRIHNLPVPTVDETTTILLKLINEENPGAHSYDVHRVLGSCRICGEMVGLCVAKLHVCKAKEIADFSQYISRPFAAAWPPHDWILARDAAVAARFGSAAASSNTIDLHDQPPTDILHNDDAPPVDSQHSEKESGQLSESITSVNA